MPDKLNRDVIAKAGLELLRDNGIDGVTMRSLADRLGVRAPTLYWHVRNKRELLDAMADVIAVDAAEGMRPRRANEAVDSWLGDVARTMRASMLRYRDGARVFVGSMTPSARAANEAALTELTNAGFSLQRAAEAVLTLVHYTTGSVIEEQARTGVDYADNPYTRTELLDAQDFPLTAQAAAHTFNPDGDAAFDAGLAIVLAGIRATRET